ncbi:MAG: TetR/AcrR family transcriptional regulator, partial [Thermodesulfobacteriota bacterium]|nr:TetR/AcrR family transcriptional regulator [Thermodesulfobacteriota bacterium]
MTQKKHRVKDKETRIKEIQSAARKVFFKKGYLASTVEEIAKQAGIAKGTVYLYFDNKDDLYISLMVPPVKKLGTKFFKFESEIKEIKLAGGPELIKRILDILYKWCLDDPDGSAIAVAFQQGGFFSGMSDETLERLNKVGREAFGSIRRIISHGKQEGL